VNEKGTVKDLPDVEGSQLLVRVLEISGGRKKKNNSSFLEGPG